jgi:hypothetical protein
MSYKKEKLEREAISKIAKQYRDTIDGSLTQQQARKRVIQSILKQQKPS